MKTHTGKMQIKLVILLALGRHRGRIKGEWKGNLNLPNF